MKKVLNWLQSLSIIAWVCWIISIGTVMLAFMGAEQAGVLMARPPLQVFSGVLALWIGLVGVLMLVRGRFAVALLHLGCACVMTGWLIGRAAERQTTLQNPISGAMALIDGDRSDKLWSGVYLTNYVGRVPFTITLEKFFVERYPRSRTDIEAGREAPVSEYRSRIRIDEPGKTPYVANVRVNQPVYVRGYHIYQMSWGQSQDMTGRPITYTVLQFIRDPGLPFVYAGFMILLSGILLYALKLFRLNLSPTVETEEHP